MKGGGIETGIGPATPVDPCGRIRVVIAHRIGVEDASWRRARDTMDTQFLS